MEIKKIGTLSVVILLGFLGPALAGQKPASFLNVASVIASASPASYADGLAKITPAVVAISPQGNTSNASFGTASGVLVSSDGHIVTNRHILFSREGQPPARITVKLADRRHFDAKILADDELTDIAILKIDGTDLPAAPLGDSDTLRVGDVVFAIGYPMEIGPCVSMGVVSALNRSDLHIVNSAAGVAGYENFIQTDASINPGNSGGALADASGRLVGITTAILSPLGTSNGLGFALPSNLAESALKGLAAHGYIPHGYLGLRLRDLPRNCATPAGIAVVGTEAHSPASDAGIFPNDLLLACENTPLTDASLFRFKVAQTAPGTVLKLSVRRAGQTLPIAVTVGDLHASAEHTAANAGFFLGGIIAAPASAALCARYGVSERASQGIFIVRADAKSPYAKSFPEGLLVSEINHQKITAPAQAATALRMGNNLLLVRDRQHSALISLELP